MANLHHTNTHTQTHKGTLKKFFLTENSHTVWAYMWFNKMLDLYVFPISCTEICFSLYNLVSNNNHYSVISQSCVNTLHVILNTCTHIHTHTHTHNYIYLKHYMHIKIETASILSYGKLSNTWQLLTESCQTEQ